MKLFIDFSLLTRNRTLGLLLIGNFSSLLGDMITYVSLPYQIYQLTHSTWMVGLLSLCQVLPLIITALFGGVIADRHSRRKLLLSSELLLILCAAILAGNASISNPSLWVLFLIGPLMSALDGIHRPALDSFKQQLVSKEDISAMSGFSMFSHSTGMIVGPAIAGIVIAHFGFVLAYLLDLLSFIVSITCLLQIKNLTPPTQAVQQSIIQALFSGFRYAYSRQELIGTYAIDFLAMIFGMPIALFPAYSESFGGASVVGLFYSAIACGSLLISLMSGWTRQIRRHGLAIAISASFWGVAIIGFGFSHHLFLALFFLFFAGLFDGLSGIFRMMVWNETIPQEFRGRLAGIEMLSYLCGPRLGDAEAGFVASLFGLTTSIVSGGVLCILSVILCSALLPKFLEYVSEKQETETKATSG